MKLKLQGKTFQKGNYNVAVFFFLINHLKLSLGMVNLVCCWQQLPPVSAPLKKPPTEHTLLLSVCSIVHYAHQFVKHSSLNSQPLTFFELPILTLLLEEMAAKQIVLSSTEL